MTTWVDAAVRIAGRYRLVRELSSGAESSVWEAEGPGGELVALKLFRPESSLDPELGPRIATEAELAARVSHPCVAGLVELATHDGVPVLVMQRCPGETLRAAIRAHSRFDAETACRIAILTLQGVAAIHAAGVVHGDLKPDNIVLSATGHEMSLKIIDFGASVRCGNSGHLANGDIFGTPEYMSPERARGEPLDERTDVYAVGIVLHEMLTGVVPFAAETPSATVATMLTRAAPSLRRYVPQIANDLDAIVLRSIAKAPSTRPDSALAFARLLAPFAPP